MPGLLKHLQETPTLEILPPLKLAKRFREMVSTLELRWILNLFEAWTISLQLYEEQNG